jgi:phosphatidylglycerol---prolipoprotein diacylglyceryl transferase
MYGMALALSAATTAGTVGMPFFQLGSIGPIQSFGIIVAAGVLIGAALLRRYAEWHGVSDDHIRGLTGWITVTGFIGAHVFDVLAYQWRDFMRDPVLMLKVWSCISSYGGFIGGALGFAFYVWWKKLPARLMADIGIVGLLPAFSIGRIGCTVVSDHIGALVGNKDAWYAGLAMEYPADLNMDAIHYLLTHHPEVAGQKTLLAWNLGFIEMLYLIPVNALVLWLAFRKKRVPAGFLIVLTGMLYAPVRFFLDYLRPPNSDPRHFGFTFAQWASILAFAAAAYVAFRVFSNGKVAETVAPTSKEAQERLRMILKGDDEDKAPVKKPVPKATVPKATAKEVAKEPEPQKTAAERKADLIAAIKGEKKTHRSRRRTSSRREAGHQRLEHGAIARREPEIFVHRDERLE